MDNNKKMIELSEDEKKKKSAVLFSVQTQGITDEENSSSLIELRRLVKTLGLVVVGMVTQRRPKPDPAVLLGPGKLKELAGYTGGTGVVERFSSKSRNEEDEEIDEDIPEETESDTFEDDRSDTGDEEEDVEAGVVVYDGEISPRQLSNLEKATGVEVLDRTGVILEIFSRHAKSREAMLQVEIAKLAYMAPRLRASHIGGDRQGAGIGTRGAGETSHELDKRRIRDRISELKARLVEIKKEQDRRRDRRKETFQVSLVGYTNAGKSSIMRKLTGSDVLVEDKLFATLDTRVKTMQPEGFPLVLVSDTVGFIKKLPHDLVASFQSTLDEALAASLLLYIVDIADPAFRSQLAVTKEVIREIGGEKIPWFLIMNKSDKLAKPDLETLRCEFPDALFISAHNMDDIDILRAKIIEYFKSKMVETTMVIPYNKGSLLGQLRTMAEIKSESYSEAGTSVTFMTTTDTVAWLKKNL